ncbi:MAG TPA: hypothetical protein VEQ41_04910 [Solirubrobacterales bacterium]|nr:hypothetical protein [Solirubrobacterales bacterium]
MEAMRQSWTDERLDDFRAETARHFDEVNRRFDEVNGRFEQVNGRFEEVNRRFEQVDDRFNRLETRMENGFKEMRAEVVALRRDMDQRLDALHRMMFRFSALMITALIAALTTFATQL